MVSESICGRATKTGPPYTMGPSVISPQVQLKKNMQMIYAGMFVPLALYFFLDLFYVAINNPTTGKVVIEQMIGRKTAVLTWGG